jgi:hypothetical protein
LRAALDLWLRDSNNLLQLVTFRVDSGSEMTTLPASLARQLDLPMPLHSVPNLVHAQTGLEISAGLLRAQVVGMDGTEYAFPCYFLGDPDTPPDPRQPARLPRNLLGLTGVVDRIRIAFDGKPTPTAAHGVMVVEKQ